jgi:hypothetical protein
MSWFRRASGERQCPFNPKLRCSDCRLNRTGFKLKGLERKEEPVDDCVFHLICDNIEAEHIAIRRVQAEMGETKQAAIFQALALIMDTAQAQAELKRVVFNNIPGLKKLFGVAGRQQTSDIDNLLNMIDDHLDEEEEPIDANRQLTS